MNKEQALNKLLALEEETCALRAIIEAPDKPALPVRWRPEVGSRYNYVLADGEIDSTDNGSRWDKNVINCGNCFKTREHAEIAAKAVSVTLRVCAAAFAVDPDAGVQICNERMWTVMKQLSIGGGEHEWVVGQHDITTSHPCYVHKFEQAERMAAILNAEGV
jgi:hypothetical protein